MSDSSPRPASSAFSLLLPVYHRDRPDQVTRAFRSTVQEQLLPPSEVVIVQDGRVGPELASALERLESSSPVPVTRLRLSHSVGLAQALQCGLSACSHDVIARMDADDVSLPHRFAVQLPLVDAGHDIVGSALVEFGDGMEESERVLRVPPTTHDEIVAAARLRSPFNHPTVVYRRTAVLEAGGYRELPLLEDYWLFTRMLDNGARAVNVPEPLVMYRVDAGAYQRRGGMRLLRSEVALQRRLHAEGFTSAGEQLRNIAVRGGYRITPTVIRRAAYRRRFTSQQEVPAGLDSLPTATTRHRHVRPLREREAQ